MWRDVSISCEGFSAFDAPRESFHEIALELEPLSRIQGSEIFSVNRGPPKHHQPGGEPPFMKSITEIPGGAQLLLGVSFDLQETFEEYLTTEQRAFLDNMM
jgi:hypothetical protein